MGGGRWGEGGGRWGRRGGGGEEGWSGGRLYSRESWSSFHEQRVSLCYRPGEAMMIAKKEGVDMKLLFDAMRVSSGNSFCWETEFARVVDGTYYPDFSAEMMLKDVELGSEIAKKHNIPLFMHGQVAQIYQAAIARYGRECGSTIPVRLIEEICQTPLVDDKLKDAFKQWTYTSEIVDGSYLIVHKGIENPFNSRTPVEEQRGPQKAAAHGTIIEAK